MLHVRLIVPTDLVAGVEAVLRHPGVVHVARFDGVVSQPEGHLLMCDLAPEAANQVVEQLQALGLAQRGSIMIDRVDTVLSAPSTVATAAAPGDPAAAVLWEDVLRRVEAESQLTPVWLILLVTAVLIAAIGVLSDSAVLIVGAMVVGPEYGPVASVAVGLHLRSWSWVRRGAVDLLGGFALAIPVAALLTWAIDAAGWTPAVFLTDSGTATTFISHPDVFSLLVAALAGVAGTLSLTLAKASTLVGVLISVTTVPAAAAMGVYAAHGRWSDFTGSAAQLASNLALLALVGALTLAVQLRFQPTAHRDQRPARRGALSDRPRPGSHRAGRTGRPGP